MELSDEQLDAITGGVSYTVAEGDTVSDIARRYGISQETLLKNNPDITDPNYIQAGWKLNINVPVPNIDDAV